MNNERLYAAMDRAGLSIEAAARLTSVDPKTVQRWVAGRVPHQRHRWALAQKLGEDENYLWPDARRPVVNAPGAAAEVVGAYSYRSDLGPAKWWDLFESAEEQIDLLGFTLYFLPQQHPGLLGLLTRKCDEGCKVRIALADPDSEHVRWRDEEEHQAITIRARIFSSLDALSPLLSVAGAELRFQNVPLYSSIFRFDDRMLVTPHLYATPGHAAPLFHLRRLAPNGLFDRYASHFEGIWSDARPMGEDRDDQPARAET